MLKSRHAPRILCLMVGLMPCASVASEVGWFWWNRDTGVAEVALKLGVWLEKTVILKCVGLYQFLRRGCLVVCRKLVNFLVIFGGFSAEFCGKRS